VALKPKLPSKIPCQNALQKWPRNPSYPPKLLAKTPYKSGPETQAALQNSLPKCPTKVALKLKLPFKMLC